MVLVRFEDKGCIKVKLSKRIITLGLAMLLVLSVVLPVGASSSQGTSQGKQTVQAGGGVSVTLQQAMLVPYEEEQLLSFTIDVKNQGSDTVNFYNQYWFKLSNKQGRLYSIKMVKPNSYKVSPGQSKQFSYYAQLPQGVQASQLNLTLIQWDFNAASFERALGNFSLQKMIQNATHLPKQTISIHYFEQPLLYTVNTFSFADLGDSESAYINTTLQNKGSYPLTIPDLQYELVTPQGKAYPLKSNQSGIVLNPDEKMNVTLFATVPPKQQLQNSTLFVLVPSEKENVLPITAVKLQGKSEKPKYLWGAQPVTLQLSEEEAIQLQFAELHQQAEGNSITLTAVGNMESKDSLTPSLQYRWGNESTWKDLTKESFVQRNGKTYLTLVLPKSINLNNGTFSLHLRPQDGGNDASVTLLVQRHVINAQPFQEVYPGVQLNLKGSYHYPDGKEDVVVSQIQITNTGENPFRLPQWTFQYEVVGGKKYDSSWSILDNVNSDVLSVGEQATILVTGRLPFGVTDQNLRLALGETFTIKEVNHQVSLHAFPLTLSKFTNSQELVSETTITNQERDIHYKIKEVKLFETTSQNIMVVRFITENRSNRFFDYKDAIAFIQTDGGYVFPTTQLPEVNGLRSPLQKDMITFFTVLPKGIKTDDMKVMLAESLPVDKDTTVAGKVHYFAVNPKEVVDTTKELEVFPYRFSVDSFRFNKELTAFRFMYEKETLDFIQQREETPTIKVEVRQDNKADGKLLFSKTILLDGTNVTPEGLVEMESHVNMEGDARWVIVNRLESYQPTVFIYEEFNGAKFLLATKKLYK